VLPVREAEGAVERLFGDAAQRTTQTTSLALALDDLVGSLGA
jgi:hypothetical protein